MGWGNIKDSLSNAVDVAVTPSRWDDAVKENAGMLVGGAAGGVLGAQVGNLTVDGGLKGATGAMGGGGDSTSTVAPWLEQQPYLLDLYENAQGTFEATPNSYDGDLAAGVTPEELVAREQMLALADQVDGAGNPLYDLGQATARGDYLMADSNPYLRNAIDAAIDPVQQRLQEEILPQISSAAVANGAYGGARQDILTSERVQDFNAEAGRIAAGMTQQNYENERRRQQQAGELTSQGIQLNQASSQLNNNVGQANRTDEQINLDANREKFEMNRDMPWNNVANYAAAIGGSQGSVSTKPEGSWLEGAIGGGLTAASLSGGNPWATGAGAIAGAFA